MISAVVGPQENSRFPDSDDSSSGYRSANACTGLNCLYSNLVHFTVFYVQSATSDD